jgi:hypothetical protein
VIAAMRWDPLTMDLKKSNETLNDNVETQTIQENPFQRMSKLTRSPEITPKGTPPPPGVPLDVTESPLSQVKAPPKKPKSRVADMLREYGKGEMSNLEYVTSLVNELSAFVATKNNVHSDIKVLVVKIQKTMLEVNKEWKVRAESVQKKVAQLEDNATPLTSSKRTRPSPESSQTPATAKKARRQIRLKQNADDAAWRLVANKKKTKPMPASKPQPREARMVRPKTDALVIAAKDPNSYAAILRKMKQDPNLKDLGSQVSRIRRTKNGEMLFELKCDPSIKSSDYKDLMAQSLVDDEVTVRALTQEMIVECRNLDEITTEEELREALNEQFSLGEIGRAATIKLRRAYGATQTATIKLPVAEAKKLLVEGKVKVGWIICHLQIPQTKLLRCYKCLGFGHVATRCTDTDRSKMCWRCGEEGHIRQGCKKKPKCMLCSVVEGNGHATGSLSCKAYKAAKAREGWR